MRTSRGTGEDGAAAVELALVLPLLLLLVFGVVDFGRAYSARVELAHAAREGVRAYALTQDPAEAATRTRAAAVSLEDTATTEAEVGVTAQDCDSTTDVGDSAVVTATFSFDYLTPLPDIVAALPGADELDGPITLTESGVMRCGG